MPDSDDHSAPPARRRSLTALRSARWFAPDDLRAFGHRSRTDADGLRPRGLCRQAGDRASSTPGPTSTRATPTSSSGSRTSSAACCRPAASRSSCRRSRSPRPFVKPTTMLYRNFLAMETEELLRCHPVDGAVLMGGCDKTTPALLMGAISAEPAGDLRAGRARCCAATGAARCSARAPTPGSTGPSAAPATSPKQDWNEIEGGIARSPGTA